MGSQQYLYKVVSFDINTSKDYLVTVITYGRMSMSTIVTLWDLETGQEIGNIYEGYTGGSYDEAENIVQFSDDDKQVIFCENNMPYGGGDLGGNVSISIDMPILQETACNIAGRNLTHEEWNQYVGSNISYEKTCPNFLEGGYSNR